jgi:arylsulfatase A-like enzyme
MIALAVAHGNATPRQLLTGAGAAFLVSVTTATVVGAVIGPAIAQIAAPVAAWLRSVWRGLLEGGDEASRRIAAQALALVAVPALWCLVAYRVTLLVLFEFARPDTMTAVLVLALGFLGVILGLAWPVVVRLMRGLVDAGSERRGLRWVLVRPWPVPAFLLACAMAAIGAVVVTHREILSALTWWWVAPVVLVVPGAVAAFYFPRLGGWQRRGTLGLAAVLLAGSVVAGLALRPESSTAQSIAFDRAMSGRLGYMAWTLALDFDRDGQINVLGGGDCAPFDPHRYTGADDVPGNGIDEDCDGADLSLLATDAPPRAAVPAQRDLPARPSIILITIDALGAPRLKALGSPKSLMPNLDAFVDRSRLFTHAYSQGPSTRLSFPSLFTSRWDSELVFLYAPRIPYSISAKDKQIQGILDDADYETAAVIPSDYFGRPRWPSVTRDFQHVDDSAVHTGKHNAPAVTDAALRILSENRDRPLYLWAHYYDAHPPYGTVKDGVYPDHSDKSLYEAELTYLDRELGRLLTALSQRPDPTYVIISADHSSVFHPDPSIHPTHYGYDLNSATLHVPLIVNGPKIQPGRVDTIVSTMDIAPTIADLARRSGTFHGRSLLPEILSDERDPMRTLYHELYLPEFVNRGKAPLQFVSIRNARFNLILNRARGGYELYDYNEDYYEQKNLYEDMARTPEVAHLRSLLSAFINKYSRATENAALASTEPPL